jgi:hypothetical protein
LGAVWVSQTDAEYSMGCAALWWIFSSNKSGPANRKNGFYMIQASLYLAAQNVELFSNNQNQYKIFKIYGG